MALLVLAFLLMPLIELWVILQVGEVLGGWWTVLLLFVDSVVGAVIVRREGRRAWSAFRDALSAGRWPADEVAQGALVLVGGALLLTPGFVTDGMGLAFVLPPTRAVLARMLRARVAAGSIQVMGFGSSRTQHGQAPRSGRQSDGQPPRDTLDVEVVSVERESEREVEREVEREDDASDERP